MKIPLDKVKPDPNQPRKIFSEKSVENLAKSMKIEGLIHPIEVDESHMIIVGEMRYRAATLLGWKEIEANVYKGEIKPYERLRRQMAENLQQSGAKGGGESMNPIDTATGWLRLMKLKTGKDYRPGRTSRDEIYGLVKQLGEEVGVAHDTIYEHLQLLEQPSYVIESMVKPILRDKPIPRTYYREADQVAEKWQEPIKKAISEGKIERREDITRFANITKTKPDKAEIEFLRITRQQNAEANRILNRAIELSLTLASSHPENFSPQDKNMIRLQLKSTKETIDKFLEKI